MHSKVKKSRVLKTRTPLRINQVGFFYFEKYNLLLKIVSFVFEQITCRLIVGY